LTIEKVTGQLIVTNMGHRLLLLDRGDEASMIVPVFNTTAYPGGKKLLDILENNDEGCEMFYEASVKSILGAAADALTRKVE
jgi:hypothetical protein